MKKQKYQILIVDDHPMVRKGFCHLIASEPDLEVCGEAEGMSHALELFKQKNPDLLIIDLSLADGSGLDLIEHIKAHDPDRMMLVASMHDESLYAERVLVAGARGYINKQEASDRMIYAIKKVLAGKVFLSETMTERLINGLVENDLERPEPSIAKRLTNRELTVFVLIGEGKTTGEIARQLNLSVKTIESHQANIKKKLGLGSAHELSRSALQWSIEQG